MTGATEPNRRRTGDAAGPADEELALWSKVQHEAWHDLTGPSGFMAVFGLTLASIVVMQADDGWRHGPLVTTGLLLAVVVLSFSRAQAPRRWRWTAIGAIVLAVAIGVLDIAVSNVEIDEIDAVGATPAALLSISLAMTLPAVLAAAFGHRRVTLNTVTAAITAYLLLGLLFASVFRAADLATSEPFFAQAVEPGQADFVYFSFVTLTTVGYGDMTPVTGLGRGLATLEALIGQIYLVTTVAIVVSRLGQHRRGGPTAAKRTRRSPEELAAIESARAAARVKAREARQQAARAEKAAARAEATRDAAARAEATRDEATDPEGPTPRAGSAVADPDVIRPDRPPGTPEGPEADPQAG